MKAAGIDSATMSGIAFIDAEGHKVADIVMARQSGAIEAAVERLVAAGVTHAFIEEVFHGPNPKTTIMLAKLYGEWSLMCKFNGIRPIGVHNATWKHAQLTVAGHYPPTSKEQKKQSIWVATKVLGFEVDDDNEADACCLWDHGQRQLDMGVIDEEEE